MCEPLNGMQMRLVRTECRVSQDQVGAVLKLPRGYVSRLELGYLPMHESFLERWAAACQEASTRKFATAEAVA